MKKNMKILTLSSIVAVVSPIAAVVSCGSDDKKATNPFSGNNPFSAISTGNGDQSSLGNVSQSTLAEGALKRSAGWSMGRNDDQRNSAGESGPIATRKETGVPLHPAFTWNDLWNWNPIANADGSIDKNPEVTRKIDYKNGANAATYTGNKPQIDNIWGLVDKKFLRASVPYPAKREYGEEMLPSQATIAQYWDTRTYNNVGAVTGMVPGVGNGSQWTMQNSFTYQQVHAQWTQSAQWSIWEAMWPSADYIDVAHRYGVPVLGLGWMMTNYTRPEILAMITAKGPNGDYPIAKGMVELANYIGFDGWWMDWEAMPADIGGFVKALMSYAKLDQYTTDAGVTVKLSEENKKAREMYHYGPREQIIAQYGGDRNSFGRYADHFIAYQNHGDGKRNREGWTAGMPVGATDTHYDKFWSGSASNYDEDGVPATIAHHWDYYSGESIYAEGRNPGGALSRADLDHRTNYSMWYHNQFSDEIDECLDIFSSYTRDPRVAPRDKNKLSVGNMYRERTPIVGRKSFASNFSVGKGSHLSFWGSKDLINYTQGAGADGWKHQGIQDVLPTYNWVIDYYNGTTRLNDPLNPTYTADGRVERPTNLILNYNADKAWYGGTTLNITGDLPQGQTMETKLYASRTELKAGDKVSFKVRNNWKNESDRVLPKLALWTTDQTVPTQEFYQSNGTEDDPEWDATKYPTDPTHQKADGTGVYNKLGWDNTANNAWDKMPKALHYQKAPIDSITDAQKTKTIIDVADAAVTNVNNDWIDVTYTVPSSLDGKTMLDFGFAADSKGAGTISKLTLGQIAYNPVDETPTTVSDITNVTTDDVFRTDKITRARISWDTMKDATNIIETDKIRQYILFYLDEKGNRESVSWIGSNSAAYLDLIDRTKNVQNIEIVAVDNNYNAIFSKKVAIKLAVG